MPRPRRLVATVAAVALLVLSACRGGGDEPGGTEAPTTSGSPAPTAVPVTAPLTGLPGDPAKLRRPALIVKIDNGAGARPQAGIDRADVLLEEMVEGGLVRFMAIFQSQDADNVGPVRSVRPVDPDIVSPLRGLFAYAGGAPQFEELIRRAPVTLLGYNQLGKAYRRRRDRAAPHNLYTSTSAVYAGAPAAAQPPPPLFPFLPPGQPFAAAGAGPATHLSVRISGSSRADWDYDAAANGWRRGSDGTPHTVEGGGQLILANVIVQFVPYSDTSSRDPAGNPVPTANVVGTGPAIVLSGGKLTRGTWSKASATAVTGYADSAGAPIRLTPGTTWITLAPTDAGTAAR